MTVTTKSFEVSVDNERAALAFDLRSAIVDHLRHRVGVTLSRAEDAGVDKETALRRFSMLFAGTAKAYRLPRTIPAALVSWAAYAEYHKVNESFPAAPMGTIGTFDRESMMTLPGNVALIKMGGVTFAGICEGGKPDDLFEIRVGRDAGQYDGKYRATLVCGRFDGDSRIGVPTPVTPEGVDA